MTDIVYEEQEQLIKMWKDKYYEKKEEVERLNNRINKAIEYIEEAQERDEDKESCSLYIPKLLEILKGE